MPWVGYGIVVRHAVTPWDKAPTSEKGPQKNVGVQERVTGWLDPPLRHQGLVEAQTTAHDLASYPLEGILTSPLQRARATAQALAQPHQGVRIQPVPALMAWNTGLYSGQTLPAVKRQLDQAVKQPDTPVPWGESFAQFIQRFLPVALQIVADPRLLVMVTHGMNLEVLIQYHETGSTQFDSYSGMTGRVEPGEAVLITPQGLKELAA